jgi:glycine hydroxymethyltransferase
MVASGIRVGTPALTSRGMREGDMEQVAKLVSKALHNVENETVLGEVKRDVRKMCERFPLYTSRLEMYDRVLGRG